MPSFTPHAEQSAARQGLVLDSTAALRPTVDHFIANNGPALNVSAQQEASVNSEQFPYRHFDVRPQTHYAVELRDAQDRLKWTDDFDNLVTTEGLNELLDATFKTGNASPTWYVGLVDGGREPSYLAAHSGWDEFADFSEVTRQTYTPSAPSGGSCDNSADRAKFSITGTATVAGCFLASVASGTSGKLYGVGAFSGGSRAVEDGDILRITATLSVSD